LDSFVQSVEGVVGTNRHRPLGDDRPVVDTLVDKVHRDSSQLDTCGEGLTHGIEPGKGREQRWMNVDDSLGKPFDGCRAKNPHEPREHNRLGTIYRVKYFLGESGSIASIRNDEMWDPGCLGLAKGGTFDIADHGFYLADIGFDESVEVRPGTADQDNVCHVGSER
jgi:hypothetical protein